jgi:hypothetical protein
MQHGRVTPAPTIRFDAAAEAAVFDQVVALGDRNNKSLGFLPYAGFRSAAAEQRIVVALGNNGSVLGYCLFDLPRDVVRIVHLCIADGSRGTQLARRLVEAVTARHSGRLGLVLKCRADWDADRMWPKLGFSAQTQVVGRSKQGHPLTVWWRSNGHADLFTLLDEFRAAGRAAAVDSNVYCDLHTGLNRSGKQDTSVLAPLIAGDQLNLVLLPTLESEIYRTQNPAELKRFLNAKLHYSRATTPGDPAIRDRLLSAVPNEVLAKDESLRVDAQLVAEAHANAVDLFITRDENAIRYLFEPAAEFGIEVLHPTDVLTFLDAEQRDRAYQPARLAQTAFTVQRLDRGLSASEISTLLDMPGRERLVDLRRRLKDLAGRATDDVRRMVLFKADGGLCATWAYSASDVMEVALLRVVSGPLQSTLAAQLTQMLRRIAIDSSLTVVKVTDQHVPAAARAVMEADGFYRGPDGWTAMALPVAATWPEVSAAAQRAAEGHGSPALHRLLDLPEEPSRTQTSEFERLWAPAKILGQGVPNYLVPIKRQYASQLLGHPASLWDRPDDLGLSREHVYYSSRRGPLSAPARVLWYVSGKTDPSVIASSTLLEVRVDAPWRLHRRFARLGVWDLQDIERVASRGSAAAFRFADTELFSNPVGLDRLRALAPKRQPLVLRSALVLDDDWFEAIYREGVGR